jgi:hypothetical protein
VGTAFNTIAAVDWQRLFSSHRRETVAQAHFARYLRGEERTPEPVRVERLPEPAGQLMLVFAS